VGSQDWGLEPVEGAPGLNALDPPWPFDYTFWKPGSDDRRCRVLCTLERSGGRSGTSGSCPGRARARSPPGGVRRPLSSTPIVSPLTTQASHPLVADGEFGGAAQRPDVRAPLRAPRAAHWSSKPLQLLARGVGRVRFPCSPATLNHVFANRWGSVASRS